MNKSMCKIKILPSEQVYPTMKRFYPDGRGLILDDPVSIHKARGLTEWFDEDKNDVTHTLWTHIPVEHMLEILE